MRASAIVPGAAQSFAAVLDDVRKDGPSGTHGPAVAAQGQVTADDCSGQQNVGTGCEAPSAAPFFQPGEDELAMAVVRSNDALKGEAHANRTGTRKQSEPGGTSEKVSACAAESKAAKHAGDTRASAGIELAPAATVAVPAVQAEPKIDVPAKMAVSDAGCMGEPPRAQLAPRRTSLAADEADRSAGTNAAADSAAGTMHDNAKIEVAAKDKNADELKGAASGHRSALEATPPTTLAGAAEAGATLTHSQTLSVAANTQEASASRSLPASHSSTLHAADSSGSSRDAAGDTHSAAWQMRSDGRLTVDLALNGTALRVEARMASGGGVHTTLNTADAARQTAPVHVAEQISSFLAASHIHVASVEVRTGWRGSGDGGHQQQSPSSHSGNQDGRRQTRDSDDPSVMKEESARTDGLLILGGLQGGWLSVMA